MTLMRKRSNEAFKAYLLGDFERAGHLYQAADLPKKALRCFMKAGNLKAAASVETSLGLISEAAKHLVEGGFFLEAADLLATNRQFAKSARLYAKGGNLIMAASTARRTGDPGLAAGFEEEAGRYFEAGLLWREAGKPDKLLSSLAKALQQMPKKGAANPWEMDEWQERKALIAKLLFESRAFLRAAEVYEEMAQHEPAATCFEKAGLYLKAVQHYREANNLDKVAELAGKVQETPLDLRAAILAREGETAQAAEAYRAAGAPQKAASLLEEAGDFPAAARMWEEAREWEKAGNDHFKGGAFSESAAAFRKAQLWMLAADAYEKAGDFGAALQMAFDGGDWNRAYDLARAPGDRERLARLWQGIPGSSPQFPLAKLMLARAFVDSGKPLLARECLRELPSNAGGESPWVAYLRGRVSEALGELFEAAQYYREVLSRDLDFLDAEARLARCAAQRGTASDPDFGADEGETELCADRYLVFEPLAPHRGRPQFRGHDVILDEDVLLEWAHREAELSAGQKRNLAARAKAARALRNPNVVPILDLVRHGDAWVLVQSYPSGPDLAEWVRSAHWSGSSLAERARLAVEMASGLDGAHRAGLVHGSLGPDEIVMARGTVPQVRGLVHTGPGPGDAGEAGPPSDPAGDIKAFGLLGWLLFTGEEVQGMSEGALGALGAERGLPAALGRLLAQCMSESPEVRPASMGSVMRTLLRATTNPSI
jgi:tetratricopeptide (TPR) repeat protein